MMKYMVLAIVGFASVAKANVADIECSNLFAQEEMVEQVIMTGFGTSVEIVPLLKLLSDQKKAGEHREVHTASKLFRALADRKEVQVFATKSQKRYEIPSEIKAQLNLENYYGHFDTSDRFWIMDQNKGKMVFWKFAESIKTLQRPVVIDGIPENANDIQARILTGPSHHIILLVSYTVVANDTEPILVARQYDYHSRTFIENESIETNDH